MPLLTGTLTDQYSSSQSCYTDMSIDTSHAHIGQVLRYMVLNISMWHVGSFEAALMIWHANMTSRTRTSGHGKIECIRCHKSAFWKERRVSTLSWAAWCVGGECTCTTVHAACTLYNVRLQQKYFVMSVPLQNRVSLSNTVSCARRLEWGGCDGDQCNTDHVRLTITILLRLRLQGEHQQWSSQHTGLWTQMITTNN